MRASKADKTYDPMVNGMRRPETQRQNTTGSSRATPGARRPRPARSGPSPLRGPYRDEAAGERTLVETAAILGNFVTLGRAIRAAGLVDLLSGRGPFTVFAPTDQAFARLPKEELNALLADRARMAGLLAGHIVRDTVAAPRAAVPRHATTMNDSPLTITVEDRPEGGRGFRVDGARIVKAEILASNGVIHAIDTVLGR